MKRVRDMQPGDTLVFMGTHHVVESIEDYAAPWPGEWASIKCVDGFVLNTEYGAELEVAA